MLHLRLLDLLSLVGVAGDAYFLGAGLCEDDFAVLRWLVANIALLRRERIVQEACISLGAFDWCGSWQVRQSAVQRAVPGEPSPSWHPSCHDNRCTMRERPWSNENQIRACRAHRFCARCDKCRSPCRVQRVGCLLPEHSSPACGKSGRDCPSYRPRSASIIGSCCRTCADRGRSGNREPPVGGRVPDLR